MTNQSLRRSAVIGFVVLAIAWTAALPDTISGLEEGLFRAINDLPDWIEYPGWPVMQLGSILAVPILAIACIALFRDWRIAVQVALAGTTAWVIAKVAKEIADRGRPAAFFDDINLRPIWDGLGFPSGHSAVAFAIAVAVASAVGPRVGRVVWVVAVLTGLLRIYTGAHLPLDVIGGWALGLALGSIVELAWRRWIRKHPVKGWT